MSINVVEPNPRKRAASPTSLDEDDHKQKKAKAEEDVDPWITLRIEGDAEWSMMMRRSWLLGIDDETKQPDAAYFHGVLHDKAIREANLPTSLCSPDLLQYVVSLLTPGDDIGHIVSFVSDSKTNRSGRLLRLLDYLGMANWLEGVEEAVLKHINKGGPWPEGFLRMAFEYAAPRKKTDWLEAIATKMSEADAIPEGETTPEMLAALTPYWMKAARKLAQVQAKFNDRHVANNIRFEVLGEALTTSPEWNKLKEFVLSSSD